MPGGALCIDVSARRLGWCVGPLQANRPRFGLYTLPGIADLGLLYASARNAIAELIVEHQPERAIFVPALFGKTQTSAQSAAGLAAMIELACYDNDVRVFAVNEAQARKAVLGRARFYLRNRATGKIIKSSGSEQTKLAAVNWCRGAGFDASFSDEADAIVLWHYDRLLATARKQWAA